MGCTVRWVRTICLAAMVAGALFGVTPARASSSYTTDLSDLWWDPAESGWGIQLVQQHMTIFATVYVYAASGQPEFYVAVLGRKMGRTNWNGPVYRTTGPWWGGPFDPATVVETEVGTMSFDTLSNVSAQLDYTIGGVAVSKTVMRMSFANDVVGQAYIGTARYVATSGPCVGADAGPATVSFTISGETTGSVSFLFGHRNCNARRVTYLQQGQFARIEGDYSCSADEVGTMTLTDVKVSPESINFAWRLDTSGPGFACQLDGVFAGIIE